MVRVYVSSTSQDLEEFRQQVREALLTLGHVPVAMESYAAQGNRPVDVCLRDVENCDLYICIVAWRYGFIPPEHQHSITELEYRRAKETGKHVLAFLLREDAPWPPMLVDRNRDQVEAFRQALQENHVTAYFTNPADLRASVSEAVHNWGEAHGLANTGSRTNWEAYRAAVYAKHRLVQLETIAAPEHDEAAQIPLTEVFVAQQTTAGRPAFDLSEELAEQREEAGSPSPEDAAAAAELREPSLQVIGRDAKQVFLGGPGSGKTTLLRYVMLTLCDPAPSPTASLAGLRGPPLPFLIELRQYALDKTKGRVEDFVGYLVARGRDFYDGVEIAPDDLRAILREDGRALVMFDGLDEILQEGERAQIADQLDAFANHYRGARVVVSTRIAGYNPERLQGYGFSHYTLGRFGLTEIRQFLPRWYRQTPRGVGGEEDTRYAEDLIDQIAVNPRLRELAGNPLLLTMMAIIYKHEELPEKRFKLYERCTKLLLEHWDVKRKHIEQDTPFSLGFEMTGDHKAEILQRVSMHMLENREGGRLNAIRRQPLIGIIAGYLTERFEMNRGDAEVIAAQILNHLRLRTYILAEVGEDTFGFVHRTFMEYFAATAQLESFNRGKADYEWLTELYDTNWQRDEWQEVLLLLIAMLSDRKFPVREVVDHLVGLNPRPLPWNIVFAARCLAEIGAGASDESWAQAILSRLGHQILKRSYEPHARDDYPFVDHALDAFSTLVLVVRPSESLIWEIEQREGWVRQARIVAWQMKLALRSKAQRLPFALNALSDVLDEVRVGAINALEREWPGRGEVGPRLLQRLREDWSVRVRQAAVQALRRSWPAEPGILDAIAERAGNETDDKHVEWLIRYLSSEWRHDPAALEAVLRLAAAGRRNPVGSRSFSIVQHAADGIVAGWGDWPGVGARLRDRYSNQDDQQVRDAILIAVAHGGFDEEEMLGWLQQMVDEVSISSPGTRSVALVGIERGWGDDPQVRAWLERYAVSDPDVEFRLLALALAGGHDDRLRLHSVEHPGRRRLGDHWWSWEVAAHWRGHPESLPLLENLAVSDPSPVIRRAAAGGVYAYHRAGAAAGLDLLYSRLSQEADRDTRAMILLILTEGASGGTALPRGLAVTLGFIDPGSSHIDRPFSGFARPRSSADDQLRATLTSVAEHDDDGYIRAAAGQALSALWPDNAAVSEFLAARSENDPDQDARILLRSFRTGRQAPRAP